MGNCTARKTGLYARHFSREERAGLRAMDPAGLQAEADMLRTAIARLYRVQGRLSAVVEAQLQAGQAAEVGALVQVSHSLARAMTTLTAAVRVQAGLPGADASLQDDLDAALEGLPERYEQLCLPACPIAEDQPGAGPEEDMEEGMYEDREEGSAPAGAEGLSLQ